MHFLPHTFRRSDALLAIPHRRSDAFLATLLLQIRCITCHTQSVDQMHYLPYTFRRSDAVLATHLSQIRRITCHTQTHLCIVQGRLCAAGTMQWNVCRTDPMSINCPIINELYGTQILWQWNVWHTDHMSMNCPIVNQLYDALILWQWNIWRTNLMTMNCVTH